MGAVLETIIINETMNDGWTVHLYYSPTYQQYVAYGLSAYIVNKVFQGVKSSYETDVQMPMVKVDDIKVEMLKKTMVCVVLKERQYKRLETMTSYNDNRYSEWANYLREL